MSETNDPHIEVEVSEGLGAGHYIFRKRNMRLQVAIRVETARLSEGMTPFLDEYSARFILAMAELSVLTIKAPDGSGMGAGEVNNLDPLNPDSEKKVINVWSALRDKEETFRGSGAPLPGSGSGSGG